MGLAVFGPSVSAANNSLAGWTMQGGVTNWQVQPAGNSVYVVAPNPDFPHTNGQASFFVSPANKSGTFKISITPNEEADDDYVGFALGYQAPVNNETCSNDETCNTSFLLFDWKKATEVEGGEALPPEDGGQEGFSLMKVAGARDLRNPDTSSHPACFWTHEDVDNLCDVLDTDYGFQKGYQFGITYTFQVTYSTSQLKIDLLGTGGNANTPIFDQAPPGGTQWPAGRVAFYNYSQPNAEYGLDDGTAPTTTTTTSPATSSTVANTSTTAAASSGTTSPTVGPATRSSIVRTGQNAATTSVELLGGAALLLIGAALTAARGKRPEGRFYA
jgi:hypothetical protein